MPSVLKVRDRIGAEIHRRITSAIRPGRRPATAVSALEMTFFGALVQAGSGDFTYHQIADRLDLSSVSTDSGPEIQENK